MFESVLVANRGEIAVRVIRTLRELGVRSIAVHSDADAGAPHVRAADVAVRLGPAPAAESYLSVERLVEAARRTGAQAVHPGYGFLSESAAFARACAAAGLTFIGPPPHAVEVMGDKIQARKAVSAAGVPVVPGRGEPGMSDDDLAAAAAEVGYPVLVKPAAGGGGKGMHVVREAAELGVALASARREAGSAFGDDTLFVERYVTRPRHIEVQVLADGHGHVWALGERECSLQRRHQKVVEEAPSTGLPAATRTRMLEAAVEAARAVGYQGVGTVEFIISADAPDDFFFLEMNTRLQVEHPVTELVTGLDLVARQLEVAAGADLSADLGPELDPVPARGHAIEVRLYAESPETGFLPAAGRVRRWIPPAGPGIRVDAGIAEGSDVGVFYDPMLAKVIAWGEDRATALRRLRRAVGDTTLLGVTTNLAFLTALLDQPDVVAGRLDTGLIDREVAALVAAGEAGGGDRAGAAGEGGPGATPDDEALAVFGLLRLAALTPPSGGVLDPWQVPSGWRPAGPRPLSLRVSTGPGADAVPVAVLGSVTHAQVTVANGDPRPAGLVADGPIAAAGQALVTLDGRTTTWQYAVDGGQWWLRGRGPRVWTLGEAPPVSTRRGSAARGGGDVVSPMPGVVLAVHVKPGEPVRSGQPLVVVEAMKMENAVTAPEDGEVSAVLVAVGEQVSLGQVLARL